MAIGDYIDKHNKDPKPFIWTAKAADILEKVKRAQAYPYGQPPGLRRVRQPNERV
jgi:hypothetical protein